LKDFHFKTVLNKIKNDFLEKSNKFNEGEKFEEQEELLERIC
jgi:hypothetical protein